MINSKPADIKEYIAGFPDETQVLLKKIKSTIKKAVPDAQETISYGIPCFTYKGKHLIFFAAFKKHIGLYPAPRSSERFKEKLSRYKGGKGTVQFPRNEPIPFDLISSIVKFRAKANLKDVAFNARKK